MRANPIKWTCPDCGGHKDFKSARCRACQLSRLGTISERFWSKVVCDLTSGCWIWTAATAGVGYGVFGTEQQYAHRLSYEWASGAIPEGMFVCHKCDNPPCVRPDHLFLGTPADNMADMIRKGRKMIPQTLPVGEAHWHTTLDADTVRALRAASAAGGVTARELAARHNISASAVGRIVKRQTWKHIA